MKSFKMAIEITNKVQWNKIMDEVDPNIPILAKCSAQWCGPCRALAPKFDELATKYKGLAVFIAVDIEEVSEVSDKFDISSLPTILIFHEGREVKRTVGGGYSVINELESFIQSVL